MLAAFRRRRAVVLLVSVAVLSVLAILATVFTTMSRIERSIARNYVDLVRAKLLATAGIEAGSKVLRQPTSVPAGRFAYLGEDHNASGDLANAWGVTEDVYRPGGTAGTLQVLDCPLSYALRPSLFADLNADGRPDVMTVNDSSLPGGTRQVGYSGVLAGTYQQFGDTYSIKIVDSNDLYDLNDVMVNSSGGVVEPNTRMARVINTLGQVLGLAGNEGTLIANWRAANAPVGLRTATIVSGANTYSEITGVTGGFTSVDQLSQVLTANSYRALREYLSVGAWKDLSTIRPQPQTFPGTSPLVSYFVQGAAPPDRYNLQYRFEPRAPINANTAPWAILAAAVSGVQANYVAVVPAPFNGATDTERYEIRSASIPSYSGPASTAGRIASTILWYRTSPNGPFDTWEEWNDFVDNSLVQGGNPFGSPIIGNTQGKILKAMCNPNTRSMRANPDRAARFRRTPRIQEEDIDKTDLSVYSTEFCFTPKGTFTLSSLGRVVDEGGNVVAVYEIKTVAKAFDAVRHTTARDFRRNSVSFATQYVATLPDSPPDHSSSTTEDKELGSSFDVPLVDPRWGYDGAIVQRTRDPNGVLEMYTWPSTTPTQGGGTSWMSNAGAASPTAWNSSRPREDRSLFGAPSNLAGGPGDTIKGDIFSDGLYLGSDKYRSLTYALPWSICSTSQPGANPIGMSIEYWMKPNCEGSSQTRMRRGYQFVRSDLGTQTVQLRVWRRSPPNSNFVVWDTVRYGQFTARWWDQTMVESHNGSLRMWGSSNLDPDTISGFSIVTSAPNEKFGVQWDWRSSNGPPWLYTGMWHHFYLGTWDEGYYTASEMYVDGVAQPGVLARYGDPASGWVTAPFIEQVGPFSYIIWLWAQPMQNLGNIVDVACAVNGVSRSDEPPQMQILGQTFGDPDRMFAGTLDAFRMRQARIQPVTPPSRLSPGVNAQYGGIVPRTYDPSTGAPLLPGKEVPSGKDLTIMGMEWTRYRPAMAYNGSAIPAANRPTTVLSYGIVNAGFPYTLADTTGKPQSLGFQITSSQTFQYRVRFDNRNLAPLRESAYFDDITIHYYETSVPVQFLSWQVVSQGD